MVPFALVLVGWLGGAVPESAPRWSGSVTALSAPAGDQTDPRVSEEWLAWTQALGNGSEVRYRSLVSGAESAVPMNGGLDFVTDLQGSTLLLTRQAAGASTVETFNLATSGPRIELAPREGSQRRSAMLGGRTVVWQEYSFSADWMTPELVALDLVNGAPVRITEDRALDKNAAVAPDGRTVVWTKCTRMGTDCRVWRARKAELRWTSAPFSDVGSEQGAPDTDGARVVFAAAPPVSSASGSERDVFWRPLEGGREERLLLDGDEANPLVAGDLIAFDHREPRSASPNWDVWLYDSAHHAVYALTDSPVDETVADLVVTADGLVRVAFTAAEGDYHVSVFSLRLGSPTERERSLKLGGRMKAERRSGEGLRARVTPEGWHRVEGIPPPPAAAERVSCGSNWGLFGLLALGWTARRRRDAHLAPQPQPVAVPERQ